MSKKGFPLSMRFPFRSEKKVFRLFLRLPISGGRGYRRTAVPNRPRDSVVKTGQSPSLQGFMEQTLDGPHHSLVLRGYQRKSVPTSRSPTCAADAVNVGFSRVRNIVVNDVGYPGDVDSPGGDIGRGEDAVRTVTESFHSCLAPALGKVAL